MTPSYLDWCEKHAVTDMEKWRINEKLSHALRDKHPPGCGAFTLNEEEKALRMEIAEDVIKWGRSPP